MNKLVYIASPLSGDVERNLDFARQACRFAISQDVTPFAPHLLYTQMLELCEELWLCGDRISAGMEGERKLAESLGIPVRQVSAEEIQSMDFSPTQGMTLG